MPIRLTDDQQQVLDLADTAPEVVDPRTNSAYVLVPVADYEVFRAVLEEQRREQALRVVALRNAAGRMTDLP